MDDVTSAARLTVNSAYLVSILQLFLVINKINFKLVRNTSIIWVCCFRLKSLRDENNRITKPFDSEMNLWALESIGVIALGCRLNCFDPNLPEDSPAKQLIQIIHDLFKIVEELDFKPNLWRLYATPTYKKAMKLYEEQER